MLFDLLLYVSTVISQTSFGSLVRRQFKWQDPPAQFQAKPEQNSIFCYVRGDSKGLEIALLIHLTRSNPHALHNYARPKLKRIQNIAVCLEFYRGVFSI